MPRSAQRRFPSSVTALYAHRAPVSNAQFRLTVAVHIGQAQVRDAGVFSFGERLSSFSLNSPSKTNSCCSALAEPAKSR